MSRAARYSCCLWGAGGGGEKKNEGRGLRSVHSPQNPSCVSDLKAPKLATHMALSSVTLRVIW